MAILVQVSCVCFRSFFAYTYSVVGKSLTAEAMSERKYQTESQRDKP